MSNLTQAMAMLGPAAFMTGAAAILLPARIPRPPAKGDPARTFASRPPGPARERTPVRVNQILGPLLAGIALAILMLLPGPFNPDPLLEICYLLGGFLALFMTALSAAVLTGAVLYRRRTKRAKTPKPPTR